MFLYLHFLAIDEVLQISLVRILHVLFINDLLGALLGDIRILDKILSHLLLQHFDSLYLLFLSPLFLLLILSLLSLLFFFFELLLLAVEPFLLHFGVLLLTFGNHLLKGLIQLLIYEDVVVIRGLEAGILVLQLLMLGFEP